MTPLLLLLLAWYQLQALSQSALLANNHNNNNNYGGPNSLTPDELNELDALLPPELPESDAPAETLERAEEPYVQSGQDETAVQFQRPIATVNIDYARNMIVLKFSKESASHHYKPQRMKLSEEQEAQRRLMETNFMRFGRGSQDFMRFGKRQAEQLPTGGNEAAYGFEGLQHPGMRAERSSYESSGIRDSRGDNFMRFGRSTKDFMRFGRTPSQDYMRFGRTPSQDYMRFGRTPSQDYMRFGRTPSQDYMRFGRTPSQDYMRFGRTPSQDYMRFGRTPSKDNFMRLGRNPKGDFMRFGRARYGDNSFMRFGRPDNFMRFGRSFMGIEPTDHSENFMRLGKAVEPTAKEDNQTKETQQQQKHDLRETAKLLHQTHKDADENPMDKAIQVLFSKQKQQQHRQDQQKTEELNSEEKMDSSLNGGEPTDMDVSEYAFNAEN